MNATTTLSDAQIDIYKNQLKNMLKIKDYKIINLDFLTNSQKYIAVIEVKFAGKVHILNACRTTLNEISNDLTDKYSGIIFCKEISQFSKSLQSYFM